MDAFTAVLWILRLGFVLCLYLFLDPGGAKLWRDSERRRQRGALGGAPDRIASPLGQPAAGASIPIDAVTSLGADVNNTVVVEDPAVAAEHGLLSYRGHAWYLEERAEGCGRCP
ncbi:MAG: hypothetical protein R3C32_12190 [Chloroflexota bacterium]